MLRRVERRGKSAGCAVEPGASSQPGTMSDTVRFLGRVVARPVTTGAVAPSGRALSRAMAAQIPEGSEGPILELGPGTGVVTAALIERGIAAERITAVEYDRDFAVLV